jgi:tRNA-binding EMAP/Myf-like protein
MMKTKAWVLVECDGCGGGALAPLTQLAAGDWGASEGDEELESLGWQAGQAGDFYPACVTRAGAGTEKRRASGDCSDGRRMPAPTAADPLRVSALAAERFSGNAPAARNIVSDGRERGMRVIAMRVAEARQHPNADALRVYKFGAPGFENGLQVVANMENVYEVGDMAYVALMGCVLKDGTKISKAVLRGVESFGMALGPCEKLDAEPGCDFSHDYCRKEPPAAGGRVEKWPNIEGLHHIRKGMKIRQKNDPEFVPPVVTYYSKVKLHGTNAGVQILRDGTVRAQGRNAVLVPGDDNLGFAAWVSENLGYFQDLAGAWDIVVHGEWAGKGIQKGVAISQIDRKILAVFAIQIGLGSGCQLLVEPFRIRRMLPEHPDIFILPWTDARGKVLDWSDKWSLEAKAAEINLEVARVEERDPWVSNVFGVDGTGEGLVLYPVSIYRDSGYVSQELADEIGPLLDRDRFAELVFKAKGEKHKVVKQKSPVQIDPEIARSVDEFVDMFLTEARLEQGVVEACGGEFHMRCVGDFLKWIGQDVKKESIVELEASGLEWKQVGKAVGDGARRWYIGKAKEL